MSYRNKVVKKPWGHEYLIYENDDLGIWFLHIEKGQQTSTHCHPKKNTGLIVLDGCAEISFLKNKINLKGVDKVMIFSRRFHSTKALSNNGAFILEVESPKDKHDLVRLYDSYGREDKPYENETHEYQKDERHGWFEDPADSKENVYKFCNCTIKTQKIYDIEEMYNRPYGEAIVFLSGGIYKGDNPIVQVGDVIAGHSINQIAKHFELKENSMILSIMEGTE
jgi:mannose-6-phosphate isomerase-like protein (cupin superfamily)